MLLERSFEEGEYGLSYEENIINASGICVLDMWADKYENFGKYYFYTYVLLIE